LRSSGVGGYKTGFLYPIQWLDTAHLKKSKHLKSNVLEHHPETKVSGRHPVEWPQNILANDFGGCLSKLDHCLHSKKYRPIIWSLHPNSNVKVLTMLIEHLSILVRIYWWLIMTIVSIEAVIAMKCSFVTETNIPKETWILLQCTECPSKLNSQSAIILIQFLYHLLIW